MPRTNTQPPHETNQVNQQTNLSIPHVKIPPPIKPTKPTNQPITFKKECRTVMTASLRSISYLITATVELDLFLLEAIHKRAESRAQVGFTPQRAVKFVLTKMEMASSIVSGAFHINIQPPTAKPTNNQANDLCHSSTSGPQ